MCILISINSDTIQQLRTFTNTSYKIRRFEILLSCFRYCDHVNELRISKEQKNLRFTFRSVYKDNRLWKISTERNFVSYIFLHNPRLRAVLY